jgi:long-chain fatty acid transport protein
VGLGANEVTLRGGQPCATIAKYWIAKVNKSHCARGRVTKKHVILSVHLVCALLICAGARDSLIAGGFMIPHQSAIALGLGNAMTAGVNDPSAVYYNPAALSEIDGDNLLVTGTYAGIYNSVENSGRRAVNKHDDNFLATLFANYHVPGTDLTLGIGSYTPFGLATSYDREFTRFAAERTELKTIYVTPAMSWQPSTYFSAGGGLSFVHASGLFTRTLCLAGGGACVLPVAQGRLRLTDTANAFTYNLGLLVKPAANLKVGLSYRARADIRFDTANVKLGGALAPLGNLRAKIRPIPIPPVINAGVFWQINPSWGAELVYEYARWSEFDSFSATFSPGVPLPGFSLPEDWKNTSTLRFGSSYKINRSWEVRGGLTIEETPIPNRTLNPAIPGADLLTINAGVGYQWKNFGIDMGYMAVFYKTRKITNNELEGLPATGFAFPGAPGKDKYETFNNFVSMSLSYKF